MTTMTSVSASSNCTPFRRPGDGLAQAIAARPLTAAPAETCISTFIQPRRTNMPSLRSLIDPAGRSLAYHVRRLKAKLEDLRERIRETLSRLLGETAGDVVQRVVNALLATGPTTPPPYLPHDYARDGPYWNHPDAPDQHYAHEEYYEPGGPDYDDDEPPEPTPEPSRFSRWRQALTVGLRATTWWLQQHTGRSSLLVAIGLGVATMAGVLAGGPWTVAGATLAASALSLAGVDAFIHSGVAVLAALQST
jgi:hypothetical protein